jgi:GH25 family lysozyme M1 (1,4-beta-N-acetylmuramidase)
MFRTEKIFLFLLISTCLVISVVLVGSLMDPATLLETAFARITGDPIPEMEGVYLPDLEELVQDGSLDGAVNLIRDGWNLFRSEGFAFEIQFPQQVVKKSILNQEALNTGVGLAPQAPVWEFRLDNPEYYLGTNLVDASLVIHVLEGVDQESACSSFLPGSIYQSPAQYQESLIETEINGITYWQDEVLEGVMGEFYHRIIFRTFTKGACYQLTQLLHYRNIDSYFDQEIVEFDQGQVLAELDRVLNTFTFLDIEPVFPEQSYPLPKGINDPVSKAASEFVDGLDVSHWQSTIDWPKVAEAGYVFTFAKGTEGVYWTDRKFHENLINGVDAGVMMGVYHFARPDLGNKASDEANYFLDEVGDYLKSGYLRPVLDLEVGTSMGKAALSAWVIEWMETVKNRTGISPLIYTNPNYIHYYLTEDVKEYDLWVAHWTCEPEPSYYYPNTGMWRDWAFWQYYGPGGCGLNYGYVPGITTSIDLNIFNGVEEGLQTYDALSKLWVSLTSDGYFNPAPYSAVLTGNVNGDATGLMDFAFWWECTALEADLAVVEGVCGELPVPAEGECEYNDVGMRCIGVENEKQIAEHTYEDIGNYTAKVIVKRGEEDPVEDRYKITAHHPLRYFTWAPASPGIAVNDYPYQINVDVHLYTGPEGVLQASIEEFGAEEPLESYCIPVIGNNQSVESFEFTLIESEPGLKSYPVSVRYRSEGECPVIDESEYDQTVAYKLTWVDEKPILVVQDEIGEDLPSGGVDDVGLTELFQVTQHGYLVKNPSTMKEFQIQSASFENVINVANLQMDLATPLVVDPEGEVSLVLSYEVQSSGPYSFDVVLAHDASNTKPFVFTVRGTGGLSDSPIQSISAQPISPGSIWIGETYDLQVDIDIAPPIAGVLQVSVESLDGSSVFDSLCQSVPTPDQAVYGFDLSWVDQDMGLEEYQIWARYRDSGSCPINDKSDLDLSQGYQVDWQEDPPLLELLTSDQSPINPAGVDDLGTLPLFQAVEREYLVHNPSQTSELELTGINFEGQTNLTGVENLSTLPILIGPGEQKPFVVQFEAVAPGEFSVDLNLVHTASNPSPFTFSIQGDGMIPSNIIQSISSQPNSPGQALIGDSYGLQIAVALDAPTNGALKISLLDPSGVPVLDPFCQEISTSGPDLVVYDLSWSETEPALRTYDIEAEFYAREGCPPGGLALNDLSVSYQVNWQEELPELELINSGGALIPAGDTVNLGQYEYYQTVDLSYLTRNISSTSSLNITDIRIENKVNISKVEIVPDSGFVLGQGTDQNLDISFLVGNTGGFAFDLIIEHQGANTSPYRVTFQGEGIMTDSPIQFVVPSPSSPSTSLIGSPFGLAVEIGLNLPDQGALQVSLVDSSSGTTIDQICQTLVDRFDQPRTFNLLINQDIPGSRGYDLITQYRVQGSCPIENEQESDLQQKYIINWEEEIPSLVVSKQGGGAILAGGTDIIGDHAFYQQVTLGYLIQNTSSTTNLTVQSLLVENPVHVESIQIDPAGPIVVPPNGEVSVSVSFRVAEIDNFSFDVIFKHDGSNDSPYGFSVLGTGIMDDNPFKALTVIPVSPQETYVREDLAIQVQAEIDPAAPGVVEVSLSRLGSSQSMGQTCFPIMGEHSFLEVDLNWVESISGELDYEIDVVYKALGECPLDGQPDAAVSEIYHVNWKTYQPELIVNRPEGVTIFDGAVDYVGVHDFFRYVEVTYVIENQTNTDPLVIDSIQPENLVNLREVIVEPAGVIEIQPGGSQEIKISFQVLTLEPYSFDLIWYHNGSNPSPSITGIMGDSSLDLGDTPVDSWLYRFIESLIRTGFFLKLPALSILLMGKKKQPR